MKVSSRYRGRGGEAYYAHHFSHHAAGKDAEMRLLAESLTAYIPDDARVVDFGCGDGTLLRHLVAKEKVGVEVNPVAIGYARQAGIHTVEALADLPAESYDVAVSTHALEHTLEPFGVLTDLRRVMRPAGTLLLHLPVNDWRNDRDLNADDWDHHLFTWTPRLIRNLLAEAGFETTHAAVVNNGGVGRFNAAAAEHLSPRLYRFASAATAILRRRRELRVVAHSTAGSSPA